MKPFAVLILAGGLSSRIDKFKPLLSVGGESFINRLISMFLNNDVDVYVVVGYQADELKIVIKNQNVVIVENPDYKRGMFTSVQAGVCALSSGYEAFFVMPVDIPLVKSTTVKKLTTTFTKHPGRIIYPVFHKKRGHPPLVPTSMVSTITEWNKDGNLREVLNSYERLSLEVSVSDSNILLDIDTADDYNSLVARFHHNS